MNLYDALQWLKRYYDVKYVVPYVDRKNKNYKGKTVAFSLRMRGHRFFFSFRKSLFYHNGEAYTGTNKSEINWMKTLDAHKLCLFEINGVKLIVFPLDKILQCLKEKKYIEIKYFMDKPSEDEPVINIPLKIGMSLDEFLRSYSGTQQQ